MAHKDLDLATWLETGDARLSTKTNRNSYESALWVNAIVGAIAETVAGVPVIFKKPNGEILDMHKERMTDPVAQLFTPPYAKIIPTLEDLRTGMIVNKLIDGEALLVADEFTPAGFPTVVKIGDPNRLFPNMKDGNLLGWYTMQGKKRIDFKKGEVVQDKLYNPFDPVRGLSPLKAARFAIEVNYYADAWNACFFKAGDVPSIIVESERMLQEDQREQVYKNFRKYKRDLEHGTGVFILEKVKLAKRAINVKDFEFVTAKKMSREELCAIYKMPPAEVSIFEYANYANADAQREMYYEKTVIPLTKKQCKIIQINILDQWFPGYIIEPDLTDITPLIHSFVKKLEAADKLHTKGVPFYLINKKLGLGIDRFDGDEVGYINGLPISQVTPEEALAGAPPETTIDGEEGKEAVRPYMVGPGSYGAIRRTQGTSGYNDGIQTHPHSRSMVKVPKHKMFVILPGGKQVVTNTEFFRNYIARMHRLIYDPFTKKIGKYYTSFIKAMGNEVAEKMRQVDTAMRFQFDQDKWAEMYKEMLNPLVRQIATATMYYLKMEIKAKNNTRAYAKLVTEAESKAAWESFDLEDFLTTEQILQMMKALDDVIEKATLTITRTFANGIIEIVQDGLRQGSTIQTMAEQILDLSSNRVANAVTNAQTLTTASYNTARQVGYEINGIDKHIWISMRDSAVRDDHVMQDESGQVVKVGDVFFYTGLTYPGEPGGEAKQVINCRCLTVPVIPETFGGDFSGDFEEV